MSNHVEELSVCPSVLPVACGKNVSRSPTPPTHPSDTLLGVLPCPVSAPQHCQACAHSLVQLRDALNRATGPSRGTFKHHFLMVHETVSISGTQSICVCKTTKLFCNWFQVTIFVFYIRPL